MLSISKLSFPGLGIGEFSVNSEAFTLFGVPIAWYALIITCGMIAAVTYTVFRAAKIGIILDDVLDFVIFTIPIGIIGARLYYVLAEIEHYHSLADVFNVREGGLAIYGGIITGAITVFTVAYIKKINFFAFADCCTPGIILAQAIGRWGNFMNGEAFGSETDIFCRMGVSNSITYYNTIYVHPTFLYESLWNILGFILINIFYKHKKYDGQIFLMVFGWYGLGRMFIEGLRADSLYTNLFGLEFRTSQVLAAVIFAVCLSLLIYFQIKKPNKPLYVKPKKETKSKK
ncbi:MAG: prolipoprotein diacylglyceryl transferase [Ruminococcaceae bacterium]|nr:prolipoprotein diacylglyceryl transferase [Oscillospiraceae bacterium]